MNWSWYSPADLDALLQLHATIPASAFYNWPAAVFREELSLSKTLIAKEQDRICSYISFREDEDALEIMSLGTHREFLRRGHMLSLFEDLQNYAARRDGSVGAVVEIRLEVHAQNHAAIALYDRLGFRLTRERLNYYQDGSTAHIYVWRALLGRP